MGVAYVGSSDSGFPSGIAAGNLVLCYVRKSGGAPSSPTGWTPLCATGLADANGNAVQLYLLPQWESGDTFPSALTSGATAIVGAWSNAYLDSVKANATLNGTSPTTTTQGPDDWVVSFTAVGIESGATAPYAIAPSGMTLRYGASLQGNQIADTNGTSVPEGNSAAYQWTYSYYAAASAPTISVALTGALTPSTPTNLSPANGSYAELATTPQFVGGYNNTDGSTCGAYQFRRKVSGATSYTYWNASSSAFQSTAVWNPGTMSVTFPTGSWSDGTTYNWSFSAESSYESSLTSGFATDSTVTGQVGPTLTVSAPTGTQTTATPTITWTATGGSGATISAYQVVTYLASTTEATGFTPGQSSGLLDDSGVVVGNPGTYTTGTLPNEDSITSYVQVTQTGNQTSEWVATSYSEAFGVPATPAVTAVSTVDSNGAPCVTITIVAPADPDGTLTAAVWYTDANTPTPTLVRNGTASVPNAGATVVVNDYEATFGIPRTYQVQVTSIYEGETLPSDLSETVTVTPTTSNWVISDPLDPSLFLILSRVGVTSETTGGSLALNINTSIEIDQAKNETVFWPLGKSTATIQYGDVYAATFTLAFLLEGYGPITTAQAMFTNNRVLLVRSDMNENYYVDIGNILPLIILRSADRPTNPHTAVTLSCSVTDPP